MALIGLACASQVNDKERSEIKSCCNQSFSLSFVDHGDHGTYFDPLGRTNKKLLKYFEKHCYTASAVCRWQVQSPTSKKCGKFVCAVLKQMSFGRDVADIFTIFSTYNLELNDIFVEHLL